MKYLIAIVDTDFRYAKRLAEYINSSDLIPLHAKAYSTTEEFEEEDIKKRADIVAEESDLMELKKNSTYISDSQKQGRRYIRMENELYKEKRSRESVFKYQSADEIIRQICGIYADISSSDIKSSIRGGRITGVFSPYGGCGRSSFAMALTSVYSRRESALLISFDEYRGILKCSGGRDMSQFLYYGSLGELSSLRLASIVHSEEGIRYIPPAVSSEEYFSISPEVIADIVKRLADEAGYKRLIIDFGCLGKYGFELLNICERLYMPLPEKNQDKSKEAELYEFIESRGGTELSERFKPCRLPHIKEIGSIADLIKSELTEYAAALVGEDDL